jgi:hypothetical protein
MASEEAPEVQTEEPFDQSGFRGYVHVRNRAKQQKHKREFLAHPVHEQKVYRQFDPEKHPKKEKQEKRARYPGEPVKPPNCWQLFCKDYNHLLEQKKKENAAAGIKGERNTLNFFKPIYNKLSEKEKQKYRDEADRRMKEYKAEINAFFAAHKEYVDDRKVPKRGAKAKAEGKAAPAKAEGKKRVKGETSAAKIIKREAPKKAAVPEDDEDDDGLEYN